MLEFLYLLKKLLLPAPGLAHIPELRHSSMALIALKKSARGESTVRETALW